jgi:hypothetical protein
LGKVQRWLQESRRWCKEYWKEAVTRALVIVAIVVLVLCPAGTLLAALAETILVGVALGGALGGIISAITGGSFWEGFNEGAFYGAIGFGMSFVFTGAVRPVEMTLKQMLLIGGISGIGSILLGDLGDIVIKGVKMSLKEIVIDVVVAGVTGVVFAGIAYGLSKAFKALKLKIINKGGSSSKVKPTDEMGSSPKGKYETPDVNDPRPITRQNETADLLASQGYDTEMLPYKKTGNGYGNKKTSNPDFMIEGKVFDCYSPDTGNARNIRSTISGKTEKQCNNIILNLDDCPISIDEILQAIKKEPIDGLEVLMYVKDGKVYHVLP